MIQSGVLERGILILGILIMSGILAPVSFAQTPSSAFTNLPNLANKTVGQIGRVMGTVLVDSVRVKTGAPVKVGAVIEVKSDSKATLLLGKGSVFQLAANSRLVVGEYGITPEREEMASLDLKFGKTRALILNQGPKRELKIRTRAATMGVRGTEIFIDSPREANLPVKFMTIEGLADVQPGNTSSPIPLPQNQGWVGNPSAGQGESSAPSEAPKPLSAAEISSTLAEGGLAPNSGVSEGASATLPPPPPGASRGTLGGLSDGFAVGPAMPVNLDPLQDRVYRPLIQPQFCDAVTGTCGP